MDRNDDVDHVDDDDVDDDNNGDSSIKRNNTEIVRPKLYLIAITPCNLHRRG